MEDGQGTKWARVQHSKTGEKAWMNLQTEEVFTDEKFRSLMKASDHGAVVGDPLTSTEWMSAENSNPTGVAPR